VETVLKIETVGCGSLFVGLVFMPTTLFSIKYFLICFCSMLVSRQRQILTHEMEDLMPASG